MDTLSRLISYGKKYWLQFGAAFFSMILAGFISLFPPWVVKIAVDGLNMPSQHGRIFLLPKQSEINITPHLYQYHNEDIPFSASL